MGRFKIDDIDKQILDLLIEDVRTPFTDVAKIMIVSPGTVYGRFRKMEETGAIKGSSFVLDYDVLGYDFVGYVGIVLEKKNQLTFVMKRLADIPYIVSANSVVGKYDIFCKVRAKNVKHAKSILMVISDIEGVKCTDTMVSLEEGFDDEKRLQHKIFEEISV